MRLIVFAMLALLSCSEKVGEVPSQPGTKTPPAAASIDAGFAVWPAKLEDRTVSIEWHDMKATFTGRVPVGWISRSPGSFTIPNDNPSPMSPSLSYSFGGISCSGECDDGDMQKSMATMWQSAESAYAQVSYNSGNARMDNMKLDVKTLDEGNFTDGKYKAGRFMAVRVTRPADAMDVPAFLERLEATCVRHRSKDRYYIVATVIMPIALEKTLWPLMLEGCKTPWFR